MQHLNNNGVFRLCSEASFYKHSNTWYGCEKEIWIQCVFQNLIRMYKTPLVWGGHFAHSIPFIGMEKMGLKMIQNGLKMVQKNNNGLTLLISRQYEWLTICLYNPFLPFHSIPFHFFIFFSTFQILHTIPFYFIFFQPFFQLSKSLYNIFKSQPFLPPRNLQS